MSWVFGVYVVSIVGCVWVWWSEEKQSEEEESWKR